MMPDVFNLIDGLARGFQDRLSVSTIYGEPITAGAVTVVPVARVTFGFGGGGGGGSGEGPREQGGSGNGGGGGGGGGGAVLPIGYVEITEAGSRWVPIEPSPAEQLLGAVRSASRFLPGGRGGLAIGLLLLAAQLIAGQLWHARPPTDVPFVKIAEDFA
ncbi:MAG: spore germination protein GerW family protein [Dehalococcoidia bacterium]